MRGLAQPLAIALLLALPAQASLMHWEMSGTPCPDADVDSSGYAGALLSGTWEAKQIRDLAAGMTDDLVDFHAIIRAAGSGATKPEAINSPEGGHHG